MLNLDKGLSFEQYIKKGNDLQTEALLNVYKGTKLSSSTKEKLNDLNQVVNVVVFSESYCPDCTVTVPFVKRIQEQNDNIKLFFFDRKGNEEIMEELTGDARIPTVVTFTEDMEPKGAYVEIPKAVLERLVEIGHEKQNELIQQYRSGKYNTYIEEDLVKIVTE